MTGYVIKAAENSAIKTMKSGEKCVYLNGEEIISGVSSNRKIVSVKRKMMATATAASSTA